MVRALWQTLQLEIMTLTPVGANDHCIWDNCLAAQDTDAMQATQAYM